MAVTVKELSKDTLKVNEKLVKIMFGNIINDRHLSYEEKIAVKDYIKNQK